MQTLLKTFFLVFLILIAGCRTLVEHMAFMPDTKTLIAQDKLPQAVEEFFVVTEDRVKIHNLYLPAESSDKLVIYFHGNAGNIYHRIETLTKLKSFGLNVIGVSYRGYGKSAGTPSEEGIYQDARAVFEYARKELGFEEENIILFGRSIGTAAAVNTAQNKKIAGLILVTPLTNAKELAKAAGFGVLSSLAFDAFNNLKRIKNIRVPLMVLHGTEDQVVPYALGRKLFENAKTDKEFKAVKGAGHNNLQDFEYGRIYWSHIEAFIKKIQI